MDKILTIVVPTYNMELFLRKCLDSLAISADVMPMLEVLVINDGSKDSSSEIAHEYQSRYPQSFRVIDKENGNYGSCVNRGLKEAKGKYIKVLDADDWFDNNVFKDFLFFLLEHDLDLILSDFCEVDEQGVVHKTISYNLPMDRGITLLDFPKNMNLWMHAVTYRTENLRAINYYQTEGISYTDLEWIYLPMTTVKKGMYFHKPLYMYLVGREGQTMNPLTYAKNINQNMAIFRRMMDQYDELFPKALDPVKYFLNERMKKRASVIYRAFLFKYPSILSISDLEQLDDEIRLKHPNIYALTNNVNDIRLLPFVRIKYIYDWRKNHYCLNSYKYKFLLKWKDFIKRPLQVIG